MRTLLLSTQRGWGGGENLLSQLATGMDRAGLEVTLATPAGSAMHAWARRQDAVRVAPLPGKGRGPLALWRLRRLAAASDVVLLNDPHAISYGGLAVTGLAVPTIGVRHTCFPVNSGWKHNRLLDRVVCVAEAARTECLKAGVDAGRTEVIHAGLDWHAPTSEAVAEARRALSIAASQGEPVVLAIGSLIWVKGFDTLIRAAALAAKTDRAWRLAIAGEGPDRPKLEALIDELGVADRVQLLGFRDDIPALLTAADGFVSASHREGLSLVLVEAMRAGTPVVATPVGGNGEALRISEPGVSDVARAAAPGEPAGIAAAIHAALVDTPDNAARVATAQRWAAEHFTVERMTREYVELFERMASGAARRAA